MLIEQKLDALNDGTEGSSFVRGIWDNDVRRLQPKPLTTPGEKTDNVKTPPTVH